MPPILPFCHFTFYHLILPFCHFTFYHLILFRTYGAFIQDNIPHATNMPLLRSWGRGEKDFPLLGDAARTVLLFFTGSVMVGVSVVYPGLKRAARGKRDA